MYFSYHEGPIRHIGDAVKIRTQLTLSLGLFTLVVVTAIFVLNYFVVRNTLADKAQEELIKIEQSMYRSTQAILTTAINNYLRGITESNLDIIQSYYNAYQEGTLTEEEAKEAIQARFSEQQVGDSGYLAAVEEKSELLYLDLHPFLRRQECTATEGCRQWAAVRNGYTEYDWQNPEDKSFRKKAAYVREFPPWKWIIGASSYRDEFVDLVQLDDLRKLISPVRINASGYFFLFDKDDNFLIHPELEGSNGKDLQDKYGRNVLKLFKESQTGFLTYSWKNPSEQKEQVKYAFIEHLEDFDWYLVASGYYSEVFAPIDYLRKVTIGLVIMSALVLALLIYHLSRTITKPLVLLEKSVTAFYRSKQPLAWKPHSVQEIDVLGTAFSQMTTDLTQSMEDLRAKVLELAVSEKEKEQSREFLDSIINSMPSIIIGIDPLLRVTQWNRLAVQSVGKRAEDVHGAHISDVFPELTRHLDLISESIESNSIKTVTYTSTGDGITGSVQELTVYPLISQDSHGAVVRIDEITERVEMEQRLRQSQKMDAIGQLAGGIAHDFNNMLSGIMGAAELLAIKAGEEHQPLVKIISSSARRAGELILKLLAFSRKDKIAFVPVNIHTIINDTADILARTLDRKIAIHRSLDAELHTIMGDWSQLQNSLLNIGINAGHAMPDGGTLDYSTRLTLLDDMFCAQSAFDMQPGWFIEVTIRDSGIGISQEHQKRIFEPFFTTKSQGKGTGLGLAAVYGTVVQHKGAISVYSETGRGAEFRLLFPLSNNNVDTTPGTQLPLADGEGCILIIDDEPIVRNTAQMMLEHLGYETLTADDGDKGLKVYAENQQRVTLILLDMIMPVMDGTECYRALRRINPHIKVIISSGFSRDADLDGLKNEGLCAFVRKPYNMLELSAAVTGALRS